MKSAGARGSTPAGLRRPTSVGGRGPASPGWRRVTFGGRQRRRVPIPVRLPFGADGWLRHARVAPSPNCDPRPDGTAVSLLVVHGISLPPGRFGGDAIERLFGNRLDPDAHPFYAGIAALRVSAHFLVRRDGELVQFVGCDRRAWHAGVSTWRGRERCNDFSIGVELEGTDQRPYTAAQYRALAALLRLLRRRYPITDVAGHADVAPGRKTDPGPAFDWARIARSVRSRQTCWRFPEAVGDGR